MARRTTTQSLTARPPRPLKLRLGDNACRVLRLLRDNDPGCLENLERLFDLSSRDFANVLTFLTRRGLLESQNVASTETHSSNLPQINPSYGHVLAADIGGSNLRVALADMKGNVLAKWTTSTKRTSSPGTVVQQIREGANRLLRQTALPRSSLLAVAAGAPGVTNRDAGVVFATSYLGAWKNVPLGQLLESALQVPAVIENDVKLAAIGENWKGVARGVPDFVFLAIGTGIAAGIFVNGRLVHGPNWVAGEVGYLIVPGTPDAPAKRGAPGSLERMIGGEGVKQQWRATSYGKYSRNGHDVTATGIFYHALAGNHRARIVLERSARILAYAVYNISTILNSSLFVLGGGVGTNSSLITETQRILEPYTQPSRPKLIASTLGPDAQLTGAIRLALDKAESKIDSDLTAG